MGPMQFIPTTWRAYAIDADGNGSTDPFNINDAALAAANYLCTAGGNLRTVAGQREAVFAYNHSDSYVNQVLGLARAYASGIPVADLPISGNTTGAVPAPDWSGIPAAPGPAIGAGDTTPSPRGQAVGASPQPAPSGGQPSGSGSPSGGAPSGGSPPGAARWHAVDGYRRRCGARSRPGPRPAAARSSRASRHPPRCPRRPRFRSPCRSRFRRRRPRRRRRRPCRNSSRA